MRFGVEFRSALSLSDGSSSSVSPQNLRRGPDIVFHLGFWVALVHLATRTGFLALFVLLDPLVSSEE